MMWRVQRRRWTRLWCLGLATLLLGDGAFAQPLDPRLPAPTLTTEQEPISPIPPPPDADPLKLALGERLYDDPRLSHDGSLKCMTCHDIHTNGADNGQPRLSRYGSAAHLRTLTVFNAVLSFRLNWEGDYRTLEGQIQSSLQNPANLATSVDEVVGKLNGDPLMVSEFSLAYGHPPDGSSVIDALATYLRSLLTPGSRFDRWLKGDSTALSADEQAGYSLFKSIGCVSCHQGVNIGGNLFERHGIFRPLGSPQPEILRVPSLRNVAVTAPYFHDGSAPTLDAAVRAMAAAQLDQMLTDQQVASIVGFLKTLTGTYQGATLVDAAP